jgi:1-pyrroline-5-carboxylate dehydrogenase
LPATKSRKSKITYVTLLGDETINPKYDAALKSFEKGMGRHYSMFIGDEERRSDAGEFAKRSPVDTSIVIAHFQAGTQKDAKAAIEAAAKAFETWGRRGWKERVKIMQRAAEIIDERKFEIAAAITYEAGKNRLEALAEAWEAIDAIKYFAKNMQENSGYTRKMGPGAPGENCNLICKPLGVWPVISPFNFPFMLANGMASGALITGNTVVLKPTSEAPLTGLLLYRVYRDAGVPAGAVNYVTGPGSAFESEFTTNPDVAGIAFTGSRDVGMRLFRGFLSKQIYPKPLVLEMGSKNPVIVTAKANVGKAVEGVVRAAFGYSGQKCSANSRVYVQNEIMDEFLTSLKERMSKVSVGDPRKKDTFMGPVITRDAVEKFGRAVQDARNDGGKIIFGGRILNEGVFSIGFYVEPTVVTGLPSTHKFFKDELFLPFLVIDGFGSLDEALQKANDTEYGLTAGIFSESQKEIAKFMNEIQFGVAYANRKGGATTGAWPGAQSFVGWKASGATGRGVGGPHYLLNFLREQSQTTVRE